MARNPTNKQVAFVTWLISLAEDQRKRGALAALRRGLMMDEELLYELFGYVPPSFLSGLAPGEERLYLAVATLFAYHPAYFPDDELEERHRNLGESLRLLALAMQPVSDEGEETDDLLPESLKRRMEGLLAASRDELFGHLRQVISLLKSKEIKVDWAQLLCDLHDWEWPNRPVQWVWSRSFYVGQQVRKGEETHVS